MRTREEQIAHLSCAIFNERPDDIDECIALARKHILEAERRAEQRVRAEIARDSERLDWMIGAVQEIRKTSNIPTQWILEFRTWFDSLDRDALRQAIDAAREVG